MYKLKVGLSINYFVSDPPQSCPVSELFFEKLHQMEDLGFDTVDISLMGALEKVNYNGSFTYEVSTKKYGYTLKDIKENFDMLFEKYNQSK